MGKDLSEEMTSESQGEKQFTKASKLSMYKYRF